MMENKKKLKKDYQSTKDYSKKYNKENINVQLDRTLISELRKKINISVKEFLENFIKDSLKK